MVVKIELTDAQIDVVLSGLDALIEAAESEMACTRDEDIIESNRSKVEEAAALYDYITENSGKKGYIEHNGNKFWLVDSVPKGYLIWNIGKNMVDGYLPLCRLKADQPFEGGRAIETDSLKAIRCEGAQTILRAIGHGPETPEEMEKFIEKAKKAKVGSYNWRAAEVMKEALPYMKALRWE